MTSTIGFSASKHNQKLEKSRIVRSSQGGANKGVVDTTLNVNQALQHFLGNTVAQAIQHQHNSGGQLIGTNNKVNKSSSNTRKNFYPHQTPETVASRKMTSTQNNVAYSAPRPVGPAPSQHQHSAYNVPLPPQIPANAFIPSHYDQQLKSPARHSKPEGPTVHGYSTSNQLFPTNLNSLLPENKAWNSTTQTWDDFPVLQSRSMPPNMQSYMA